MDVDVDVDVDVDADADVDVDVDVDVVVEDITQESPAQDQSRSTFSQPDYLEPSTAPSQSTTTSLPPSVTGTRELE